MRPAISRKYYQPPGVIRAVFLSAEFDENVPARTEDN
jgi:hypothetical protein